MPTDFIIIKRGEIMNVELKRVTINDIDEIIKMQKESFKLLLDKYHDGEANPYNESFDKVKYKIEYGSVARLISFFVSWIFS